MTAERRSGQPSPTTTPALLFLRDARVLKVVGQLIFVVILITIVSILWTSILNSLQAKNLTPNLSFLGNRSGFDISERPAWYSSNSNYGDAFRVGVENSLRIIALGLVLCTGLGILGGIFLLSRNWLIRTVSRAVIELLRNTPLLIQLIAWYFVVMLSLPLFQEALSFPQEGIWKISVRWPIEGLGIILAWTFTSRRNAGDPLRAVLRAGTAAAVVAIEGSFWLFSGQYARNQFSQPSVLAYFVLSILLIVAVWFVVRDERRWQLLGITVGQLLGGASYHFGLIPDTTLSRVEIYPIVLLSKRGLVLPEIVPTDRFGIWIIFVVVGLITGGVFWWYRGRLTERTGKPSHRLILAPLLVLTMALIGWGVVTLPAAPGTISVKQDDSTTVTMSIAEANAAGKFARADELATSVTPLNYYPPLQKISPAGIISGLVSGTQVTPEFAALLIGLVVYTAAFVAEIVRAGILAVSFGQIEAALALGLSTSDTLSIVVLPQALRVIIPPLGNQFLNLAKNSSLAIAVAYADLVLVTTTIMNQSGQSVTGITMIMITYLIISLVISVLVNIINRRFKIVTR